jgi:hypothetical protein
MAIFREVWSQAIQDNLYRGLEAVRMVATDEPSDFINSTKVHIPNAGSVPGTVRGDVVLPLAVLERTDLDLDYDLQKFRVKPQNIEWALRYQLSYDKIQSITKDQMGTLASDMAKYMMSQWYFKAAASLVSTTGTPTTTNWLGGSASGSLKHLTGADVRNAAKILDGQLVPDSDRYLILDYEMFWQLVGDLAYNANRLEVVQGLGTMIPDLYGFKVIQMPYVASIDSSSNIKVPAAADGSFTYASTDRPIGLAIQKSCVSIATSEVTAFVNDNDPTYYGTILSAAVYGGGKYRRTDGKGVVAIRATA